MSTSTVLDAFSRTLASGWGPADTGEAWSTIGAGGSVLAADWSVGSGVGKHSVPTTVAYRASYVAAFAAADVVVSVTASVGVLPAGGPLELGNIMLRGTDTVTYYLCRAQIETSGKVTVFIFAPGGAQLDSATTALTYTAGMRLRVTAMATGRTIRIRVSDASVAEPAVWTLIVTDSTYTGAGWVGVRNGVAGGNTNPKPVVFSVDDFTASVAQLTPFPGAPLTGTIEFAFGADLHANPSTWVYFDCTADWLISKDLAATIGGADATSRAQTAKLIGWLKNPGGHYTKGNAMSKWWPYIRKNTPCRVTLDPGTGSVRQYEMYVTQWIPRWGSDGASGRQPLVQVVANGVRRRLTKGSTPLKSPLYRATAALTPVAHWPLEDETDAQQSASALSSGAPFLVTSGTVKFGAVTDAPGAVRAPEVVGGSYSAVLPTGTNPNGWAMHIAVRATRTDTSTFGTVYPITWYTANGYHWSVQIVQDTTLANSFVTTGRSNNPGDGSASLDQTIINVNTMDGNWHSIIVMVTKTGASTTRLDTWVDGVNANVSATPHTFSPLSGQVVGPDQSISPIVNVGSLSISHVGFFETTTGPAGLYNATLGYAGEPAADRIARLCAEEGVAAVVSTADTARMGAQRPGLFVALLDECADADGGILLDGLNPGFTYLARADAYNLPVALTIDMGQRQFKAPFEPLDDDANVVNDETISRVNGSSAHYIDKTGPAGTDAIERYDDGKTLNVYSDADLLAQASWRTHVGTAGADVLRFPGCGFDLHTEAGKALIEPWLTSGIRKRVQATHPPAEYGPGPIDLLVEGYTETVRSRRVWSVAANASPYDPNRVFVVNTDRVDGDGYKLAAGVNATAVSLSVASTTGLLWGTTAQAQAGDFPFDIEVAGIRLRATGISGTSSPQTFTVTRSMDGFDKPLPANSEVRLWKPAAIAL